MTWSVSHLGPEHDVVAVTYSGELDRTQLEAAFAAAVTEVNAHDAWHILTDLRGLTAGPSVFDLYATISAVVKMGAQDRYREAVITPSDAGLLPDGLLLGDGVPQPWGACSRVRRPRRGAELAGAALSRSTTSRRYIRRSARTGNARRHSRTAAGSMSA
jgi:hypothetical protein